MNILTNLRTAPMADPPRPQLTDVPGPEGHGGRTENSPTRNTISIGVLEVYLPAGFAVSVDSAHYTGENLTQLTLSFSRHTEDHT